MRNSLIILLFMTILNSFQAETAMAQCTGGSFDKTITPGLNWSTTNTSPVRGGRYYTFTGVAGGIYYFSFCTSDGGFSFFYTQITILDNSVNYAGGYNDDNCGLQSYLVWTCPANGTYRCLVTKSPCASQLFMGNMAYRYQPPLSCPANLGTGTVNIVSLPYNSGAGTTCGKVNDLGNLNLSNVCGSSQYYNGEDQVFIFTPAITGSVTINLNAPAASYTGLMLYQGCPLAGQGGTCVDYVQSSSGTKSMTVCLQGGVTYYLVLDSWTTGCNAYNDLSISAPLAVGGCALGTGGVAIATLPYTSTGRTTCGKVNDFTNSNSVTCGNNSYFGAEDEIFSFTPTVSGQITITLSSNSTWTGLMLYDGCPRVSSCSGTPGVCISSEQSSSGSQNMCIGVIAGHTYYLLVDQFSPPNCIGNYSISITAPAATLSGSTCASPQIVTALPFSANNETTACRGNDYTNASTGSCGTIYESGEDKVYRYTSAGAECITITLSQASSNNIGYQVYNGCPGSPGTVCIANNGGANSGVLTGAVTLPTAGVYYIIIDSWAPPTNVIYDISIQSFGTGAVNDLPCNAQPLPLGVYLNGNNNCSGSASEPGTPACWSSGPRNTVWYSFEAPNSGQVTISTVPGSLLNSQIALYNGPCGISMTSVSCNDNAPSCGTTVNYMSQINQTGLIPNNTYYIAVDGYSDNTGSFGIIVIDGPPAGLPPVFGQECSVPNPVCSQVITVGDPGYQLFGSACDFPGGGSNCLLSGERGSSLYQIQIQNNGIMQFNIVPNDYPAATVGGETDYDFAIWKMIDGTNNSVVNTCATIAAGAAPIRCDYNYLGVTGLYGTNTNLAPPQFSPSFDAAYDSRLNVNANDVYLLVVSNYENSTSGFTIDFLTSPINYTPNPGYVVWTGGVDNDWFKPANWGGCVIPSCSIDAIIPPSSANMPVINAAGAACKSLTINPSASLTINGGFTLVVCQDYNNNGTLNAAVNSTVLFNNGTTIQNINGNLVGTSAFGNITVTKSGGVVNMNQNADVKGNFTVSNATSNFNANGFTHRVAGNFINLGTYTPGVNGTLELYGAGLQNYNNADTINNLVMVNTGSGANLQSNATLDITGTLNLITGKIITNAYKVILTNRNVSSTNAGSTASYVEGNLQRYINNLGSYDFPVGHSAKSYQLLNINFAYAGNPTSVDNLTARFDPYAVLPSPINLSECAATYSMPPLDNGYWTVTASDNYFTGTYDATLFNQNYTNAGSGWTIKRNPAGSGWALLNGTCTGSPLNAVLRTAMNGFASNGITFFGTAQSTSPLPVEMLHFDAKAQAENILLTWSTASEVNSKHFEIQRSESVTGFATIGTVAAAGNSFDIRNYKFIDNTVEINKRYYYRLKQLDINGTSYYSDIRSAIVTERNSVLTLQPNPYKGSTTITYRVMEYSQVKIDVINNMGQSIFNLYDGMQAAGSYSIPFCAKGSGLPAGVYTIKLLLNNETLTKLAIEVE